MANVIRIKRRASGNAGAPAALKSAELAHNEVDNTLYVGKGDDGSGNATSLNVAMVNDGAGGFRRLRRSVDHPDHWWRQDLLGSAQVRAGCFGGDRPGEKVAVRYGAGG